MCIIDLLLHGVFSARAVSCFVCSYYCAQSLVTDVRYLNELPAFLDAGMYLLGKFLFLGHAHVTYYLHICILQCFFVRCRESSVKFNRFSTSQELLVLC